MRPSNRPRCRKCGQLLRAVHAQKEVQVEQADLFNGVSVETRKVRGERLGYGYGKTNLFCSLTCGHWYAVNQIKATEPKNDEGG